MASRFSKRLSELRVPRDFLKTSATTVTPEARDMVRKVFAARPGVAGLTSQEIFEHSMQQCKDPRPTPSVAPMTDVVTPEGTHPIRSMRYLKKFVLEAMSEAGEIRKVHVLVQKKEEDESGQERHLVTLRGETMTVPALSIKPGQKHIWLWRLQTAEEAAEAREAKREAASQEFADSLTLDEDEESPWRQNAKPMRSYDRRDKLR